MAATIAFIICYAGIRAKAIFVEGDHFRHKWLCTSIRFFGVDGPWNPITLKYYLGSKKRAIRQRNCAIVVEKKDPMRG